ncbi:MAG: SDR family oxidoreductase [Candidatus Omnitrophota bacterium]
MSAKYLVTGGAGFIGSNIVERLVKRGDRVRVIDNFVAGRYENLAGVRKDVDLIRGDIRNLATVEKAVRGIDYVIHQAAFRSVPKSVESPTLCNESNVTGTLNILLASRAAGVKRVVNASSSSVYGDAERFPQREDFLPNPISPYAVSKLAAEYYCRMFSATYGLETVSLRYFNVFGPRQNPESKYSAVIPAFIEIMVKGKRPCVDGTGKQLRDFTFVSNVVDANLAAALAKNASGAVINVGCGDSNSVLDIIKNLNSFLGTKIKPVFGPARRGDVRKTQADIGRLKKILGLTPQVQFKEGLEKTLAWFR